MRNKLFMIKSKVQTSGLNKTCTRIFLCSTPLNTTVNSEMMKEVTNYQSEDNVNLKDKMLFRKWDTWN